ncbi:MAG: glycosyl hydrolase, partial [Clostridia bacterium]|nr:glycosyl hydrolase [Clostridia bacterium]
CDVWDGLAVYFSDDLEHFTRQPENILRESGTRPDDSGRGAHADIFVAGGRAFIIYFTHPDPNYHPRSAVQMAELKVIDGELTCDRNAEFDVDWNH